jgi:predicted nucleic acid-binding protein
MPPCPPPAAAPKTALREVTARYRRLRTLDEARELVAEGALDIDLPLDERRHGDRRPRHQGARVTVADYLIDTSALARGLLRQNTTQWDNRIAAGLIAICDITEPEVLYSARSTTDRTCLKTALDTHCAWCPMPDGVYHRSRIPQEQLTAKREHRSAGPVDLPVAAAAEEAGLTLLHNDRDFETIARTTGQPVRTIDLKQ